ncbi:hypothetical protein DL771_009278 [Monosporascus sp. 5C6A]|nr:hypothetical protein DL771_009278 [Monosporascus sp. 5C6A]
MRLLNTDDFEVNEVPYDQIPEYAILSHTWGDDEYTFEDVKARVGRDKKGFKKVEQCCSRAKADGFKYVWIDTCCIDKTSSAELSEAINSMYLWYYEAKRCYAYLADVPPKSTIKDSRWFTRGWTLQELIAPSDVHFLAKDWTDLGTKRGGLKQDVSECTGIPVGILSGEDDLGAASIAQRMSWAATRETTRLEDRAYSLMGIFGINMPLLYGEGERAFVRLQEEIMKFSDDHSLFAWESPDLRGGLLATSPAAFKGSKDIIQFQPFDTPYDPLTTNLKDENGSTALSHAVRPPHKAVVKMLLARSDVEPDLGEKDGRTPLSWAAECGHDCIVRLLISLRKVDPDSIDTYGRTPLWWAAKNGHKAVCMRLLDTGANLEARDKEEKCTPLLWAAKNGHEAIVKLLLDKNANVKAKDNMNHTPLLWAAKNGHEAVCKQLLDTGANLEARDKEKECTPLLWAACHGHEAIVKLLLDKNANLEARDKEKECTPLSWAACHGHEAIVKLLLDKNANVEAKDILNCTPLLWAAQEGHEAVCKRLLDTGANLEARDKEEKCTPLLWAAKNGHEAIVKLLLDKNANVEVKGKWNHTPLWWAANNGHEAIVKLLLNKNANIEARLNPDGRMAAHR